MLARARVCALPLQRGSAVQPPSRAHLFRRAHSQPTHNTVVDNLPVVPEEKDEKLLTVLKKIYGQIGAVRDGGVVCIYGAMGGLTATASIPAMLFRGVTYTGFRLKVCVCVLCFVCGCRCLSRVCAVAL